ncbi:TetR-like C-terminal domain-containing protein, partial [Bacillus sp. GMa5/2]
YMQLFEDTGVANHMVLDKNVVAEYIASAYTGMIQGWINRQLQESPNTMAERLITLNSNGPIRLLTEAEKRIK